MPLKSFSKNQVNPLGAQPAGKISWTGTSSYTRVTTGTPPSNGDGPIPASLFGLKVITHAFPSVSDDGLWQVLPIVINQGASVILEWRSNTSGTVGGQSQTSGTEAVATTNLSSSSAPILAFGL